MDVTPDRVECALYMCVSTPAASIKVQGHCALIHGDVKTPHVSQHSSPLTVAILPLYA